MSLPDDRRRSIDRVWDALDARGFKPAPLRGNHFLALCPVHDDKKRSLHVSYDAADEKTLIRCYADCDNRDIVAALDLSFSDLFDKPMERKDGDRKAQKPRAPRVKLPERITKDDTADDGQLEDLSKAKWERVRTYEYARPDGVVVQKVHREETTLDGRRHKRFTQQFLSAAGRFVSRKPKGFEPTLYRAGSVVDAIAAGKPVWLLEGEKDVDNAVAIGLVATTNAQGSGSFPESLAAMFAGGEVHVVMDNDVAGYKRGVHLHELLTPIASDVRLWLPAVDVDKADLTDHLEAGHGVKDLVPLSVDDAKMMVAAGEARQMVKRIEVCKREVIAQVTREAEDSTTNGHLWAQEALKRWERLYELSNVPASPKGYSRRGAAALEEFRKLRSDTAAVVVEAYAIAEFPAPAHVRDVADELAEEITVSAAERRFYGHDKSTDYSGVVPGHNRAIFRVKHGETVRIRFDSDGKPRFDTVMEGWGQVLATYVEDDDVEGGTTKPIHEMTVKFERWIRGQDGKPLFGDDGHELIETAIVSWDNEQIQKGTWVEALPWNNMLALTGKQGREIAFKALFEARPSPRYRTPVYTATGWRTDPDGNPFFITEGKKITADGANEVHTSLTAGAETFELPDPTDDVEQLRKAWQEAVIPVAQKLPARVMAPLFGVVWRSVFKRVPMVTYACGGAGSGKTATARLAMHFLAPQLMPQGMSDNAPTATLSATHGASTALGLAGALSTMKDVTALLDDVTATDGNAQAVMEKFAGIARSSFGRLPRTKSSRLGKSFNTAPIRATIIATGEVSFIGSGMQRLFEISMQPGELGNPREIFPYLESEEQREQRGLLGASLIQWLCSHRDKIDEEIKAARKDPNHPDNVDALWEERMKVLPHTDEIKGRLILGLIPMEHGIRLMLRMLRDRGVISKAEADAFYEWSIAGLLEAARRQDSVGRDAGMQALHYIREALSFGQGHLTDPEGNPPQDAENFGWQKRRSTGSMGIPQDNYVPSSHHIGVIKDDRVYLVPSLTLSAIKKISRDAGEGFNETTTSLGSIFAGRGWIETAKDGKRQVTRWVFGKAQRVWDFPLDLLLGRDEEGGTDPSAEIPAPSPVAPSTDDTATPDAVGTPDPAPAPEASAQLELPVETAPEPAAAAVPPTPAAAPAPQPAAPRVAPPARRAEGEFTAAAAVLHTDGLWLPDGTNVPLTRPLEHLGDIALIVRELGLGFKRGWKSEDGQVFATEDAVRELIGVDVAPYRQMWADEARQKFAEATSTHPFVTRALEAGFSVGGRPVPHLSGTTRIWHQAHPELNARLALIPRLNDDFKHLIADDPHPAVIARRLQAYAEAIEYPYSLSASTTGLDLMKATRWKDRVELFSAEPDLPEPRDGGPKPTSDPDLMFDAGWHRKPTDAELQHTYVHAFDRGGSYLAGIAGLELGIGQATHYPNGHEFDRKLPGYWRVAMPEPSSWLAPNPLFPHSRLERVPQPGELIWTTTDTLALAQDLGYELDVDEAYIWHRHSRVLEGWYGRIRDGLTRVGRGTPDADAVRALIKETYVRPIGLMTSREFMTGPDGKIADGFAPGRRHLIMGRARANIIRWAFKIGEETGRWPVAVVKDTLYYTSDESDPTAAWPGPENKLGFGLGQYKPEAKFLLEDMRPYLTGKGPFEAKKHVGELIDFDDEEPF